MANKVDAAVLDRIRVLKVRDGLTHDIIARRLGLSLRTVRYYVAQLRADGQVAPLATIATSTGATSTGAIASCITPPSSTGV